MPQLTEDFCRCGHVASAHADGEGSCSTCSATPARVWSQFSRCHRFVWSLTWEERESA